MNLQNVNKAIAVMQRTRNFCMLNYQSSLPIAEQKAGSHYPHHDDPRLVESEAALHLCGNTTCFAGRVALSPEFQEDGGFVCDGMPAMLKNELSSATSKLGVRMVYRRYKPRSSQLDTWYGYLAIAQWLDIPRKLASQLVNGDRTYDHSDPNYCHFYKKTFANVTIGDVIDKLNWLKENAPDQTFV